MKKVFLSLIATTIVFFSLVFIVSSQKRNEDYPLKVALITGYADVDDNSFNQSTYEGCKEWCTENHIPFNYYKPAANSTAERAKSTELAIDRGYNVIFFPGYNFGEIIAQFAPYYPDVTFIGIDVTENDLPPSFKMTDNVYCFSYHEEIAGYLAGYAATMEGNLNHGYLGGLKGLAVTRFGYGYVQGVDAAVQERVASGESIQAKVDFVYGGQFFGDNDITKYIDNWYKSGTEVVFSCGGGIYTSVAVAAKDNKKQLIGVDSDLSPVIERDYGPGICLTSAIKGIEPTCKAVLSMLLNGETIPAHFIKLGLLSSSDLNLNYVGLPTKTWSMKKFTIDYYKVVVQDIIDGVRTVSDDVSVPPTLSSYTTLIDHGSIK